MDPARTSRTDLVIVGAGPAGLMAAAWAKQYNVSTRILDDKPDRVKTGHADGLTCRTMEIFDSFGLADIVVSESCQDHFMRSWGPRNDGAGIERRATVASQQPGVSRFGMCLLTQGRIEQLFLDLIEAGGGINIERNMRTIELKTAPGIDEEDFRVSLVVSHGDKDTESLETINAKYLVACDGAHSWVRRQLAIELKGDSTDAVWGVMDIVPLTDFPDIRQSCAIHSASHGAMHVVPREGKLVRLYIQLTELTPANGRFDRSGVSPTLLLRAAQKIMSPYMLNYSICDWWSVYQVGQRIADRFAVDDRVFLAGDAIHTHSPKVGQGMNVSMQDTYNLGWKLCSVIKGLCDPALLKTYETERRPVAAELIEVDRATSRYYASQPTGREHETSAREDLQTFRDRIYSFMSGAGVEYSPGLAIAQSPKAPDLARNIILGRRLPSHSVVNHASVRPTQIASLLRSTGLFRVIVFTGDLRSALQMERIKNLGVALNQPQSFLHRFSTGSGNPIEIYTIISGGRDAVPLLSLPSVLHPYDHVWGWDYDRVFSDEPDIHCKGGDVYQSYGISEEEGCIICCRPDQHVCYIGSLDDLSSLEAYFTLLFKNPAGQGHL